MWGVQASSSAEADRRLRRSADLLLIVVLVTTVFTASGWEYGLARRLIETSSLPLIWIAIGGRALCALYTGGRRRDELVTVGPYAVCRHPAVLFTLIGIAGLGAQSGSLILTALFLIAAIIAYLPQIREEEASLERRIPRDFAAYRSLTPPVIPRLSLWRSPETIAVRPGSFLQSLVGSLPLLAAWLALNAVGFLQQVEMIPVVVLWP